MALLRKRRDREAATAVIDARVRDTRVEGPMAIGQHITQYHAEGDIIIRQAGRRDAPKLTERDRPVRRLPRDFPAPVGRAGEVAEASSRLALGESVELTGPAGIGKTVLLRHLAHRVTGEATRDGVLHTYCGEQLPGDLLQWLFESFVDSDKPTKATPALLDRYVRERAALIVLDDVAIDRDAIGQVADAAPRCRFAWASTRRLLWGEGASLELAPLSPECALELFEREARDSLAEADRDLALAVCRAVRGHPLRVLQAAALLRSHGAPALRRLAAVEDTDAFDAIREQSLTAAELAVLGPLAALPGASLNAGDLVGITGAAEASATADALVGRAFTESHSPRWSLAGDPGPVLADPAQIRHWRDRALAHFATRAPPAGEPAADLPAVMAVLEHGAATERWSDVLEVVRREERRLALSGRWDAWETVLQHGRRAAQERPDRAAEAWIAHQLGSRALCLGELRAGTALLGTALELRRELGDEAGALRSANNLRTAAPPTPGPAVNGRPASAAADGRGIARVFRSKGVPWPLIAAGTAAAGIGVGVALGGGETAGVTERTITGANRVVTVQRTVTEKGDVRTVTEAGETITRTAAARTVTETTTDTATVTDTVTETATVTVTETVQPSGPR